MFEDEIPLGKAKNLAGQRFGKLTALYRTANQGKSVMWKCRCDCGNEKNVSAANLLNKHSTSCGCLKKEQIKRLHTKDITGQKFGRLMVLRMIDKPKDSKDNGTGAWCECKCECGTIVQVKANHLRSGHTRSCGCLNRETGTQNGRNNAVDLTNMRFGRLVALYPTEERDGSNVIWHCVCDCGNITFVSTNNLHSGHTQSCGCLVSQGEQKISELLNKNKIEFTTQQSFEDCKYSQESNKLPRFDFFIKNSYLVEYDGKQHFSAQEHFGGEPRFQIQQQRDTYKNQWCKENNIPLIRIPYTKFDTLCIEDLLLETTQFRVV